MYFCLAFFGILTYITFRISKRDFIAPWFLLNLTLFAVFVFFYFNRYNWEIHINSKFIGCVILASLSWGLGTFFANFSFGIKKRRGNGIDIGIVEYSDVKFNDVLWFAIAFLMALIFIAGCFKSFKFSLYNFTHILNSIYASSDIGIGNGFLVTQSFEILRAIAYVSFFRILEVKYILKNGKSVRFLWGIIILFFVAALVSTDRNYFVRFAIYCVCLWVAFYKRYSDIPKRKINKKLVSKVIIIVVICMFLFWLMGKMKEYKSNFLRGISIYFASGLYDFNLWLDDFQNEYKMGAATFSTFLNVLKGFKIIPSTFVYKTTTKGFYAFRANNGYVYASNIYSALQPYYEDFGIIGVILYPFIISVFYQKLYRSINKGKLGVRAIIYAMLIYYVVYFPVAEQLLRRLHLGMLYEIGWVVIIYNLNYKSKLLYSIPSFKVSQLKMIKIRLNR